MLESLGTDAVAILSKNIELQLLETRGGDKPYQPLQDYCNTEVTILWLGQHLTTDLRGEGSRLGIEPPRRQERQGDRGFRVRGSVAPDLRVGRSRQSCREGEAPAEPRGIRPLLQRSRPGRCATALRAVRARVKVAEGSGFGVQGGAGVSPASVPLRRLP